jgi:aryl-alcohol dehydrogenase-like predicted oxidoreductase
MSSATQGGQLIFCRSAAPFSPCDGRAAWLLARPGLAAPIVSATSVETSVEQLNKVSA